MPYTLAQLVNHLDVTIQGDPHCVITGIGPIQQATPGSITFLTNPFYRKYLPTTQAAAVILTQADASACPANAVISTNPYYTYAKVAAFFEQRPARTPGIHSSASIGVNCHIDSSAAIAAQCVIGQQVTIGANVTIGAGCVIGDHCVIAADSQLDANVTLYSHVQIGKRTHIASGVVIGSDGFGFANHAVNQQGPWQKVPQLGRVMIGDDVDIGANTTIDRGALEDTIIEDGVKLDNLIQVGHNVKIGAHTVIAGCVAIAGSTTIGKNCIVGGATCFAGHITVADHVMLTGMTAVTKSISEAGIYSSGIVGTVPNHEFRKNNARFHRLENLMTRVKHLEATLKEMKERK